VSAARGLRRFERPSPNVCFRSRIRVAKDTGLRNLFLHGYAQNQIWCEIVALACELFAWMAMLALTGSARRWKPKRLRLRRSPPPTVSSAAVGT
jgi:Transposase DDE domain group 1